METRESAQRLDHETSEQEFAEFVDRARRELDSQRLVELLPERTPVYQGRSANTVNRMRGYLLAAFEAAGLPEEALPYVLEELESGRNAYLVAAAARALRGRESRSSDAVPFLLRAIENIKYADDAELAGPWACHGVAGDRRYVRLARERGLIRPAGTAKPAGGTRGTVGVGPRQAGIGGLKAFGWRIAPRRKGVLSMLCSPRGNRSA
jgi:hypothetical protein